MKRYHNVFIILAGFLICGSGYAQSPLNELAGNINPGLLQNSKENELRLIYLNVLKDPETLNFIMKDSFRKKEAANFLEDLQIKFQTLQTDKKSYLGISYDFKRNFAPVYFNENSADKSGLDVSFAATGNISLDRAYNPNDFLKSSLSFGYFNSSGGAVEMTDEISGKLTEIQIELSKLNKDELNKSVLWKDYLSFAADYLTTQIYYDFSFKGSLESNQDFTSKQYTFGAQLGFDLKAWNRYSFPTRLNVFDWPFAFFRWMTGADDGIIPRGSAIPVLLFDLTLVDPKNDKERIALKETGGYARLGLEASFKTFIGKVGEKDLFFGADLRYYKEADPPAAVKMSGLDESFYFTAALTHSDGLFFSYSAGKLPLDKKKDEVYSLGFRFIF